MKPQPTACAACSAPIRRSTGLPICLLCMHLAEAIFRRTHSALDRDWIPSRNRFFGKPGVIVAAVLAERMTVAV